MLKAIILVLAFVGGAILTLYFIARYIIPKKES